MDRNTILAFALSIAVYSIWLGYQATLEPPPQPIDAMQQVVTQAENPESGGIDASVNQVRQSRSEFAPAEPPTTRDPAQFEEIAPREVAIEGHKTWQIQADPRSKDVAEDTGYSKSIVWVRQDNYVVVRAVRWVNKSQRRKYMQIKKQEQIDGIWVGTEMQMVTKEGRRTVHATILNFDNVKFNQALDPAMFTVRRLEKGI